MQTMKYSEFSDILLNNAVGFDYGRVEVVQVDSVHFDALSEENIVEALKALNMSHTQLYVNSLFVVRSGSRIIIFKNRYNSLTGGFTLVV